MSRDVIETWADRFVAVCLGLFFLAMLGAFGALVSFVSGCTVTYEPETKTCMVRFDPSAEQIKAVGSVCMDVLTKVRDEPAKVEVDPEDSGI